MFGTIVNSVVVIIGSFIGIFLRKGIKEDYKNLIMDGIGLCTVIIGVMGAIESDNIILAIISIVLGSIVGEYLAIENKLDRVSTKLEERFGKGDANFSKGFITAFLMFCIGAMAIVGPLEAGLTGNYQTLFAKASLDGISSILLASTLGIGVAFAAVPMFMYQGSITLLSTLIKDILTTQAINEMSAVGSILIMAIGINILGIKRIKVGNMIPAVFVPLIYYTIVNLF